MLPIILLSVLAVLLGILILLTAPHKKTKQLAPFLGARYAHRGLHGKGRAENSLSAFRAAVEAGFGIELDVRVSADGEVVVVHDPTLERVAGIARAVREMRAEELATVSLLGTGEGVPTLAEVLALVDGRVPLLIEIKEDTAADCDVVPRLLPLLAAYRGPILVESFNPLSLGRVRRGAPHILRGLLCDVYHTDPARRSLTYRLLELFLLNVKARPQFLAYHLPSRTFLPFRLFRTLYRMPCMAWTVRSEEEETVARESGFATVIFEGYCPKDAPSHPHTNEEREQA